MLVYLFYFLQKPVPLQKGSRINCISTKVRSRTVGLLCTKNKSPEAMSLINAASSKGDKALQTVSKQAVPKGRLEEAVFKATQSKEQPSKPKHLRSMPQRLSLSHRNSCGKRNLD